MKYFTIIGEQTFEIEVVDDHTVRVNGETVVFDMQPVEPNLFSLIVGGRSHQAVAVPDQEAMWEVVLSGERHHALVQDELTYRVSQAREVSSAAQGTAEIKSPMPGLIIKVPVAIGDAVVTGQTVVILESMKMENELKSPRDGVVQAVTTAAGDSVEKGQKLVTIGDDE